MEVRARLPVSTGGEPRKTSGYKEILCSEMRTFTIPEIDRAQTRIVFESSDAYYYEARKSPRFAPLDDGPHEVLEFDGEIYRPVTDCLEDVADLGMFDLAYPLGWSPPFDIGYRAEISYNEHRDSVENLYVRNPLTRPLFEHFHLGLAATDFNRRRLDNFWPGREAGKSNHPDAIHGNGGKWWPRNNIMIDDVIPKLGTFDHDRLDESRRMGEVLMSGFIVTRGRLWEKCRPPVYMVHAVLGEVATALVEIVHPPRYMDTKLSNQYFALDDKDGAMAYAEGLALSHRMSAGGKMDVTDKTVAFEVLDDTVMDFDHAHDELFRISCAFAIENKRFLTRQPSYRGAHSDEALESVDLAHAEVLKTNFLEGVFGNPGEWLPHNAEIWAKSGRHQGAFEFGDYNINTWLSQRAHALHDDREITVPAAIMTHRF